MIKSKEQVKIKLVVLGSSGYRPSDFGQTACYAIPELGITLDACTGMSRLGEDYQAEQLDVYLSHHHHHYLWGLAYLEFAFSRKRGDRCNCS